MYSYVNSDQLLKILNNSLVNLPTPSSISMFWNLGSLLGLCLMMQLLSGVLLAMHYSSDVTLAFNSIDHLMRDVNLGWLLRIIHANGASLFFISLYLHMSRGLYYSSYQNPQVWMSGVTILFLVMATAFLGYVLPWGQMSFWGATVITNLFSAIPYFGGDIVFWLWGGYAVSQPTLSRFFSFHFLIPFLISGLVLVHMLFLHNLGSSNPLGLNSNFDKILFHPYFTWKDLLGFILALFLFFYLSFLSPWMLGDPENFIPANPLVTPLHIQPEWYFLFAYAILRSIPNKLGGVIALIASVAILYIFPLVVSSKFKSLSFNPLNKKLLWNFVSIFFALTWIGARPVEAPYIFIGQTLTVFYFLIIFIWPLNLK